MQLLLERARPQPQKTCSVSVKRGIPATDSHAPFAPQRRGSHRRRQEMVAPTCALQAPGGTRRVRHRRVRLALIRALPERGVPPSSRGLRAKPAPSPAARGAGQR